MATPTRAQAELCRLRRDIARIEGRLPEADRLVLDAAGKPAGISAETAPRRDAAASTAADVAGLKPRERRGLLRLGFPPLDGILGGGLPLATLHEIRARESRDGGAASGFVLALLARLAVAGGAASVLWISQADARRETGHLYPPGLVALGLDPARIIQVAVRTETEALWAFEAALACSALGVAICEMRQVSLDLSATRRCVLRAREAGVTGFLLRLSTAAEPSAAQLRFRLSPAPAGTIGQFTDGVGRTAWRLILEKNRGGRTGAFTVEWNAHERCFAEPGAERRIEGRNGGGLAYPQPLPALSPDRPPEARENRPIDTTWRHAS